MPTAKSRAAHDDDAEDRAGRIAAIRAYRELLQSVPPRQKEIDDAVAAASHDAARAWAELRVLSRRMLTIAGLHELIELLEQAEAAPFTPEAPGTLTLLFDATCLVDAMQEALATYPGAALELVAEVIVGRPVRIAAEVRQ